MQSSGCFHVNSINRAKLGFHHTISVSSTPTTLFLNTTSSLKQNPKRVVTTQSYKSNQHYRKRSKERVEVRGKKENVWSVDNEAAKAKSPPEKTQQRRKRGRRVVRGKRNRGGGGGGRVMVSAAMLMEVETVLQTQEPVIKPAWNTFISSVSGIWNGVGAVFSPITAEMEPIEIGNKNEHLYDCYTLSRVEAVPSPSGRQTSQIQRKINWVTLNPHGEVLQHIGGSNKSKPELKDGTAILPTKEMVDKSVSNHVLPSFESFNFKKSDLMEEDFMGNEPGLVFFEDGSYSRGPVDIPVGEVDDSKYYLSPTFKFEQCLVKGCHKRLRIVHTIEFTNGGSDIQIMRVAVYEEQWVCPANISDHRYSYASNPLATAACNVMGKDLELEVTKLVYFVINSDLEFDLKPFSQRKRTQPSELTGSWKVFEVSATPVFGEGIEIETEERNGTPYVYLCTETLKNRSLPESSVHFGEEEMLDMQDVTMLWLPGGVTAYVDVKKDGTLCIGVGWYSDEGMNLVMERDYEMDGKLKEVRWKTEVKRRWSDPLPA